MDNIIIGLEIHIELHTLSKMFCGCSADHFGKTANTQTCPVCLGLPGALPVPNKKALDWTILTGLALGGRINKTSKFDRKNYFYPDLPKGYQISQYDQPLCTGGKFLSVGLRRVHLEEDTAKLIHQADFSLIDFNRSGIPLVEIVTEPEITSPEQAKIFLQKLQQLVRFLGISQADMEKGQMRCEPTLNLKISKNGRILYTPLVEIKNVNSFKFVKAALDYEIKRQLEEFNKTGVTKKAGNKTTRGWNEKKGLTVLQREKEEAADYRYFPEPDIPPIEISNKQISNFKFQINKIELPDKKMARFIKEYGLSEYQAGILTASRETANDFEKKVNAFKKDKISPVKIANVIINKKPLSSLINTQKSFLSDENLLPIINSVLQKNQKAVADYKSGKTEVLEFLLGLVMRETKGKIEPQAVRNLISKRLK